METAAVAQWKMVDDDDDLLYFPTIYSVGLALYVLVGYDTSPSWTGHNTSEGIRWDDSRSIVWCYIRVALHHQSAV